MIETTALEYELPPLDLLINGQWVPAADGARREVASPSTGRVLGQLAMASAADVDAAVAAARHQFREGEWSRMEGAERGKLLWKLADAVAADRHRLAWLEAIDNGRPISEPFHGEIPMVESVLRYFAGLADKLTGSTMDLGSYEGRERHSYTLRKPLGVIGAITPWNAPSMIASWKIAPALAVGNTLVIKPAVEASLSTLRLAELALDVGIPPGVLNVVTGAGSVAGDALVNHPDVAKISFTGSGPVGRRIAAACAGQLKKVGLELGGKSPQIVRPDADLPSAAAGAAFAVFANQGQTCAAGSRILVHRSILDEFVALLKAEAEAIVPGDPLQETTRMGTLVNAAQLQTVLGYIDGAHRQHATLIAGGRRIGAAGYFVEPTLFLGEPSMDIAQQEIFGPVGTIIPYETDQEALEIANGTEYGLTAVLWTNDAAAISWYTRRLEAGTIWVNAWGPPHPSLPWAGVKGSGLGQELGTAAIHENTLECAVSVVSPAT